MFTASQVIAAYESLPTSERALVKAAVTSEVSVYEAESSKPGSFIIRSRMPSTNCKVIAAIKAIRSATGFGLKEAKALIDNLPSIVNVPREVDVLPLKASLAEYGFTTN